VLGQFKEGKFTGKGTYYYANGNKYIGYWMNDSKSGQGIFKWSDGGRYEMECSEKLGHCLV